MASANHQLMDFARAGDLAAVKTALANGADIEAVTSDELKQTALMLAAERGEKDVVQYIISQRANIEAQNKNGWTALMCAAHSDDNGQIVKAFLSNGANMNTQNNIPTTEEDAPKLKNTPLTEVESPTPEIDFEKLSSDVVLNLVDSNTQLSLDDLSEVSALLQEESGNWEDICTHLHIKRNKIDELKTSNQSRTVCLNDALTDWLKLNYNYQTHGKPTWRMIAKSVIHVNNKLFLHIASLHTKTGVRVA